jgi:hypothetical protein
VIVIFIVVLYMNLYQLRLLSDLCMTCSYASKLYSLAVYIYILNCGRDHVMVILSILNGYLVNLLWLV